MCRPKVVSNTTTGKKNAKTHHCKICNHVVKTTCFKKGHMTHCEATMANGKTCGEVFATLFGCSKHAYVDGFNLHAKPEPGQKTRKPETKRHTSDQEKLE